MTTAREPSKESHVGIFPAGDPALHLRSMAYPRAIGLQWGGQPEGRTSMILPFGDAVLDKDGRAVDVLAVIGALDQACSAGVYTALTQAQLIATVDLRVEFAAPCPTGRDIVCQAWTVWLDDSWALTRAEARCAVTGKAIAFASSAYAMGTHPGAARMEAPLVIPPPPTVETHARVGGFARLLGLRHDLEGGATMPFRDELVGAQSLPSLHGGCIAAALGHTAMETSRRLARTPTTHRLLTLSTQFLRAAEAKTTLINADLVKSGRRLEVLTATAHQGDSSRPVARAECVVAVDG